MMTQAAPKRLNDTSVETVKVMTDGGSVRVLVPGQEERESVFVP